MLSKLCAFAVFRFFLFSVPKKLILFAIGIVWRWCRCGEKKVEAFQSLSLEVRSCSSSCSCCCSCVQTDFSKTLRGAEGRKTETHTRVHFFLLLLSKIGFCKNAELKTRNVLSVGAVTKMHKGTDRERDGQTDRQIRRRLILTIFVETKLNHLQRDKGLFKNLTNLFGFVVPSVITIPTIGFILTK
jgi:hypothetical protein